MPPATGSANFHAGPTPRPQHPLRTLLVSQEVALPVVLAAAFVGDRMPTRQLAG
jgi:hypothetical protein